MQKLSTPAEASRRRRGEALQEMGRTCTDSALPERHMLAPSTPQASCAALRHTCLQTLYLCYVKVTGVLGNRRVLRSWQMLGHDGT